MSRSTRGTLGTGESGLSSGWTKLRNTLADPQVVKGWPGLLARLLFLSESKEFKARTEDERREFVTKKICSRLDQEKADLILQQVMCEIEWGERRSFLEFFCSADLDDSDFQSLMDGS